MINIEELRADIEAGTPSGGSCSTMVQAPVDLRRINRRPMKTGSEIHPMSKEDETFWKLRAERKAKEGK